MQAAAALLVGAAPAIVASPFDWRALVAAEIAVLVALLTNPRLVSGLSSAMPAAGSSAVLPVTTLIANPTNTAAVIPQAPMQTGDAAGKVMPRQDDTPITVPITPPRDVSKGAP